MTIQHAVIIPQREFEQLPVLLGQALARFAAKGYGFKLVNREDGKEIDDRLADYLVGVVGQCWNEVLAPPRPTDPPLREPV